MNRNCSSLPLTGNENATSLHSGLLKAAALAENIREELVDAVRGLGSDEVENSNVISAYEKREVALGRTRDALRLDVRWLYVCRVVPH